jgi:hypothetical protein
VRPTSRSLWTTHRTWALACSAAALATAAIAWAAVAWTARAAAPPAGASAKVAVTSQVNVMAFGTVAGDGKTDDHAAIQRIINANPGRTITLPRTVRGSGYDASGGAVPSYHLKGTLKLPEGTILQGESGPLGVGTMLQFAPGVTGILMAGGCVVRDLTLSGSEPWHGAYYWEGVIPAGRYPGVTERAGASAADGIRVAGPTCRISNVSVMFFGRDGINASAGDQHQATGLGAEDCQFDLLFLANNRGNGLRVQGGDGNCNMVSTAQVFVNQFWGIDASAFLAGTFVAPQATENGVDNSERLNGPGDSIQAIASLVRSGNSVTLTWADPYATLLRPGDGVRVISCPDPSFVGRWRVLTLSADKRVVRYNQVAPDASTTGGIGRANSLPPDGVIRSAVRANNAVTLTFARPYLVPNHNYPFRVGQGVTLVNCADASFNGTFVVLSVSPDQKTVTYAQAGPNASIASGTARMAVPADTWQAAGLLGGAYYSPNRTNRQVWVNPYAEGGQRTRFSSSDLLLGPVWAQAPDYGPDWQQVPLQIDASGSQIGLGAVNQPLSVIAPYDAGMTSYSRLGATAAQTETHLWQDPTKTTTDPAATVWKTVRGPNEFAVWHHDPTYGGAVARLRWFGNNATYINSEGGAPVRVNADPGTGPGLLVGDGTAAGPTTAINGGTITLVPVADAAAPNGSIYLGSDHGGALCRKDTAGKVHVYVEAAGKP